MPETKSLALERRARVRSLIRQTGVIRVEQLCRQIQASPATVRRGIAAFLERTGVDELMVTAAVYDQAARLRSFELVAQAREALAAKESKV